MPAEVNERRLPSAGDEARFWALIQAAWAQCSAEANRVRRELAARAPVPGTDVSAVDGALPVFLSALADQCRALPAGELTSLDRVLERKLHDIGRADIRAVTDGSDDGFLYARGFIVAMGRDFYHAVAGDPQVAVPGAECEAMCYFFAHLHRERFGEFPGDGLGDLPGNVLEPGRLSRLTPALPGAGPDHAVPNPYRRPAPTTSPRHASYAADRVST